ncbi:MAG: hypothetical protein ACJAU1_000690 [Psychromonas sp.]
MHISHSRFVQQVAARGLDTVVAVFSKIKNSKNSTNLLASEQGGICHSSKVINMAISEFEIKMCERELEKFLVKHRPPVEVRNQVDIAYRINKQSVEIFEVRAKWSAPAEKIENNVAKATYVKSQKLWKVYWQRADLKWHSYEPCPTTKNLEAFLELVGDDAHACFFA